MVDYLLQHHSYYALFKLHWVVIFLVVAFLYIKNLVRSPLYQVTTNQKTYFSVAIILLLLIKATPFDVIANEYLFFAHVLKLSLIYFVAIPFFILSLPTNYLRQYIWNHRTKFALKILAHPWVTLIVFNGLLTIYLIPVVFNIIHTNIIISFLMQSILVVSAFFMWWVIIHPIPEMKGLDYLLRALYIFLASLALFPIGFFYVIIQQAQFPVYIPMEGALIGSLTAIYDQQLAGGILKVLQLGSYSIALLVLLFKWGKQEEAKEGTVDEEHIRYARGVVIHLDKDKK